MWNFLARRSDPPDLRIPSITTLGGAAGRALEHERKLEIATDNARADVQEARALNAARVAAMGVMAQAYVQLVTETHAAAFPEYRPELDVIRAASGLKIVNIVAE